MGCIQHSVRNSGLSSGNSTSSLMLPFLCTGGNTIVQQVGCCNSSCLQVRILFLSVQCDMRATNLLYSPAGIPVRNVMRVWLATVAGRLRGTNHGASQNSRLVCPFTCKAWSKTNSSRHCEPTTIRISDLQTQNDRVHKRSRPSPLSGYQ
jgi:hypothetical protein